MTDTNPPSDRNETRDEASVDRAQWGARFGWIVGAIVGLAVGFLCTWLVEKLALQGKPNAIELAAKVASPVFAGCFLLGAVGGHYLGARRGERWYKPLGVAAGILLLTTAWLLLSIAR